MFSHLKNYWNQNNRLGEGDAGEETARDVYGFKAGAQCTVTEMGPPGEKRKGGAQ